MTESIYAHAAKLFKKLEDDKDMWRRALHAVGSGFITFNWEHGGIPFLMVVHEETVFFRIFMHGQFQAFDMTGLLSDDVTREATRFLRENY